MQYSNIIHNKKDIIENLAAQYNLDLVVLFGSQATGKTHKNSDVDIAVLGENYREIKDILQLTFDFSQKLKIKDTDLEIVDLKNATPLLLQQIVKKSILLYEKEPSLFAEFKIYAIRRFLEAKKLFQLKEKSLNRFLKTHAG